MARSELDDALIRLRALEGLQQIGLVILGHPIVEPRISTYAEQAVDALGELAQLGLHVLGKLGRFGL
jgi:hypothetical protein